jgi:CheY-like chemotaxis protein
MPVDTSPGGDALHRLNQLPLLLRQVFLLTAMEDFSIEETGFILSRSAEDIAALQEAVNVELAHILATNVLIIEDDPFQGEDLKELFVSLGHNVVGIARTYGAAVRLASEHRPGLVTVDVQLDQAESGMNAAREILKTAPAVMIFVTAYPERFLTGARPEPAFLISKPFQPSMVAAVASQALFFGRISRLVG